MSVQHLEILRRGQRSLRGERLERWEFLLIRSEMVIAALAEAWAGRPSSPEMDEVRNLAEELRKEIDLDDAR